MVKLNLKDAYLQVPIHLDHQEYLVFQWNSKFYQFTCLPFDLSAAPRAFTKLLKPVVWFLRQIGCHLIIFLDNILIIHQDSNHFRTGGSKLWVVRPRSIAAPMKGIRSFCTIAVCKAHSEMQSISILRGSGACPPGKFWKIRYPDIQFQCIFT